MYSKRLKFLQNKFKENTCMSGILTDGWKGYSVGTPCIMLKKDRFYPYIVNKETGHKNWLLKKASKEDLKALGLSDRKMPKIEVDLGTLSKLQDMGVITQNELTACLNTCGISLSAAPMCSLTGNIPATMAFNTFDIQGSRVSYRRKPPLIYDSIQTSEAASLDSLYNEEDLKNFHNIVNEMLKDTRSVNVTITDVKSSRLEEILIPFAHLMKGLLEEYPENVCLAHSHDVYALIDTISISFYKLDDFIPMFDIKKGTGIAVEVLMTNSEMNPGAVVSDSLFFIYAFSKQRENLFTIDGEAINRPSDVPTLQSLTALEKMVRKHTVNDQKKSTNKKREDRRKKVCAE